MVTVDCVIIFTYNVEKRWCNVVVLKTKLCIHACVCLGVFGCFYMCVGTHIHTYYSYDTLAMEGALGLVPVSMM